MDIAENFAEHSNILLQKHRCGRCAEAVSAVAIMRQEDCSFCGSSLAWQSGNQQVNVLNALKKKWRVRKWLIFILIASLSFFAGQVPLLQSVFLVLSLMAVHLLLIRKPLQWLPTGRKVFAKMDIKLIGILIAVFNLIINVLVMPFILVNGVVLAVLGILNTFLFVHFSTKVIESRLKWEVEKRPFGAHDWMRTAVFLSLICMVSLAGGFIVWGMVNVISTVSVPFTGQTLSEFVFEGE